MGGIVRVCIRRPGLETFVSFGCHHTCQRSANPVCAYRLPDCRCDAFRCMSQAPTHMRFKSRTICRRPGLRRHTSDLSEKQVFRLLSFMWGSLSNCLGILTSSISEFKYRRVLCLSCVSVYKLVNMKDNLDGNMSSRFSKEVWFSRPKKENVEIRKWFGSTII